MRALVQRVLRAEVTSRSSTGARWETVGAIGAGLCAFVGVTHDDDESQAVSLAAKIFGLRVFDDEDGVMNRSLSDLIARPRPEPEMPGASEPARYGVLVVSQFTLYGDTRKGRRPSWAAAARPDVAEPLVDLVTDRLRDLGEADGLRVATGRFRTEMRVDLVNDGPVTVLLEV